MPSHGGMENDARPVRSLAQMVPGGAAGAGFGRRQADPAQHHPADPGHAGCPGRRVGAGAICGLFNPAQGLVLSPLAVAFLVGYGVELFFKLLDTLIASFDRAPKGGSGGP